MTTLLFVRHGESTANRDGIFGGNSDVLLTETGIRQAEKAASFIKETYSVDAVYSSNLSRAKRTAEAIAEKFVLPVFTDERLHEISGGVWNGLPFDEIKKNYPEEFKLWNNCMNEVCPPQGETIRDVQERAYTALCEIAAKNDGKNVVIVAHRCVIRALQCIWDNIPLEEINRCSWVPNCSVSEIIYDGGKLIPVNIGQASFMADDAKKVISIM